MYHDRLLIYRFLPVKATGKFSPWPLHGVPNLSINAIRVPGRKAGSGMVAFPPSARGSRRLLQVPDGFVST
jgi:hypothetical protein